LSTFTKGTTLLDRPQVVGRSTAVDLAIHGLLEQDRGQHAIAVECRAVDDPRAHGVHQIEHLLVARVGFRLDAVQAQRLRRAAAAWSSAAMKPWKT
jgi:hypothetical protein